MRSTRTRRFPVELNSRFHQRPLAFETQHGGSRTVSQYGHAHHSLRTVRVVPPSALGLRVKGQRRFVYGKEKGAKRCKF
ncbi:hypothetical protein MTO96_036232 [Rhipicephalus appendiculatus]